MEYSRLKFYQKRQVQNKVSLIRKPNWIMLLTIRNNNSSYRNQFRDGKEHIYSLTNIFELWFWGIIVVLTQLTQWFYVLNRIDVLIVVKNFNQKKFSQIFFERLSFSLPMIFDFSLEEHTFSPYSYDGDGPPPPLKPRPWALTSFFFKFVEIKDLIEAFDDAL